ncbi:coproporphyrinogen III oxidase [bacterium]|nr:coproporphyrinogen III oxidase [bacterium]
MEDWRHGGFGLYLHWPFCQSKCPYCDFNSHVATAVDQDRWRRAYLAEIARLGRETPGRVLNSVFFGGGTPSLMEPELVGSLLEAVRDTWTLANDVEITMEANPGSVEAGRFASYRDAGVNRISVGIQALNDEDLRRLGRMHSANEAKLAYDIARHTFDRVSFDLIYARQHQTEDAWAAELSEALAMEPDHLSLYQLTIEDGTVFGARHALGQLNGLPAEDLSSDMFLRTQDMCEAKDLAAYEVSNHARPGQESRHNLIYWRMGDYGGIGPGAHGRLTLSGQRWATETPRQPGAWLNQVETTGRGELPRSIVTDEDQASEYLMMALRLNEGADLDRFATLWGRNITPAKLTALVEADLVTIDGRKLRTSRTGRLLLNAILRDLLVD